MEVVEHRTAEVDANDSDYSTGTQRLARTAVLLVGRGTPVRNANADMYRVARLLWERNAGDGLKPRSSASPAPVWQPA